jgi:hypothetical protein
MRASRVEVSSVSTAESKRRDMVRPSQHFDVTRQWARAMRFTADVRRGMRSPMKCRAAVLFSFLTACTINNPLYSDGTGGPGPGNHGDGGGPNGFSDGGSKIDLSSPPTVDMALPCSSARTCSMGAQSQSEVCTPTGFQPDRQCPMASSCAQGYCQPPKMVAGQLGMPCDQNGGPRENDCFGPGGGGGFDLSCEPFVDPQSKMVNWYCGVPVGQGTPGTQCSKGSDCRTGFCGDNGTCLRTCVNSNDCPNQTQCNPGTKATVEGVQISVGSCY